MTWLIDWRKVVMNGYIFILILLWPVSVLASSAILLTNDHDAYAKSVYFDINHAKHCIVIASYVWKQAKYPDEWPNRIARALIAAHQRGVAVEVVLDSKPEYQDYQQQGTAQPLKIEPSHTNLEMLERLSHAGIAAYFAKKDELAHLKVIVIDDEIVYVGSHNLTESGLHYNYEASVRIVSRKLALQLIQYINTLIPGVFGATG